MASRRVVFNGKVRAPPVPGDDGSARHHVLIPSAPTAPERLSPLFSISLAGWGWKPVSRVQCETLPLERGLLIYKYP